jgi:ribosomal protein S27AE
VARRKNDAEEADDRPPICPACGVTQGMVVTDDEPRFVCLECGFSDGERAAD